MKYLNYYNLPLRNIYVPSYFQIHFCRQKMGKITTESLQSTCRWTLCFHFNTDFLHSLWAFLGKFDFFELYTSQKGSILILFTKLSSLNPMWIYKFFAWDTKNLLWNNHKICTYFFVSVKSKNSLFWCIQFK